MGPRSDERGKLTVRRPTLYSQHASMGPRSDERGKVAVPYLSALSEAGLQWGRARMSAERQSLPSPQRAASGFNGAALG